MGRKNNQTTSNQENPNFGIAKGLVARRREEVIAAKEQSRLKALNPNNQSSNTQTKPKPLTHPNKSRPKIEHKKPSRHVRQSSSLNYDFFKENEKKMEESTAKELTVDWLKLIKNTISQAWVNYKEYYELGINTRQSNGWLSWWRHGDEGQSKAEKIKNKAEASDSPDKIMQQLQSFFEDPETRYENHSFASYLLEGFNRLVKGPDYKQQEGTNYNKNEWYQITEERARNNLDISLIQTQGRDCII